MYNYLTFYYILYFNNYLKNNRSSFLIGPMDVTSAADMEISVGSNIVLKPVQ